MTTGHRVVRSADTIWYLKLADMEKRHIKVSRDWFKTVLKKICDKAGVTRAQIGVIVGARAELYFDGRWESVSFDTIESLAEKGTDLVIIEKQGIIDELTVHADTYGVAMVNSRGYLTEYAHDLIRATEKSGACVLVITDYDLSGINLASKCPPNTHYITMNHETLEYFGLDIDDPNLSIEATNKKLIDTVAEIIESDERFSNIDINFLSEKRIEINAVIAQVGDERFWKFIMDKLQEFSPTRNYNRAMERPSEDTDIDETDLYPQAIRNLIRHVRKTVGDTVEDVESTIESEQENVKGFLNVPEQKKKNKDRVIATILEDECIKKIENAVTKVCEELNIDLSADDLEGGGLHSRPRKKSS